MGKAREHVRKQLTKSEQRALAIYAEDNPEGTARAGLKAMGLTEKQIEAVLNMKPRKKKT
jgi:hypothetical protein